MQIGSLPQTFQDNLSEDPKEFPEQSVTIYQYKSKIKGKVRPRTSHEGPEEEKRYSSTLSLTSALDGGWVVNATPRPLYPRVRDHVPIVQEAGWATGRV